MVGNWPEKVKNLLKLSFKKKIINKYPYPDVVEIQYVDGLKIWIRFADGKHGVYDFTVLTEKYPKGSVFDRFFDDNYFKSVTIENGTVTWPGEVDIAQDSLYCYPEEYGAVLK